METIAYFVSDLHLDSDKDPKAQLFVRFLQGLRGGENISHLFLLGDVFDLWIAKHSYFIHRFSKVIAEVSRLKNEGVVIHYFEGNHDLYLHHFWEKELGVKVHEGPIELTLAGLKLRLEHGDQMDPNDRGYIFLRWFLRTPLMKRLAPRLPGRMISKIGNWASQKSRHYTSNIKTISEEHSKTLLRQHALKTYAQSPFDLLITGHTHFHDDHSWTDANTNAKVRAINLGTWTTRPCVFQITANSQKFLYL